MPEVTDPDLLKQLNATEVTDPHLLSQLNEEAPSGTWDFFKSIPRGALKGLAGAGAALGQTEALGIPGMEDVPGPEETTRHLEQNVTGGLHRPESRGGRYGEAIGEFLGSPASYVGPGGVLAKAVTAATGAVGSEFAGQATEGTKLEPWARFIGAIVGGHAPNVAAKGVTPLPMAPEQRAIVDTLRGEGITSMTAGTETGSRGLKWAESALSDLPFAGGGARDAERAAAGEYTAAALRRVGEPNAPRATPQVISDAFDRNSNEFGRLTAGNTMHLDNQVQNELLNHVVEYQRGVNPLMQRPLIENTMNDVSDWAKSQGGHLTGEQYQNTRSRLMRDSSKTDDPQYADALHGMAESLDTAMERSIRQNNPADANAFAEARRQYRNLLVVEKAATGPGANTAEGFISPAQLASSTKNVMGRRAYARGEGDFSGLSRSGTATMLPLPQSGTAPRQNIYDMLHHMALAGLLGAGGEYAGGPMTGLAAGAAGLAVPAVAGRTLMSPPVQAYLKNQLIPHRLGSSPSTQAILNILNQQGGQQ